MKDVYYINLNGSQSTIIAIEIKFRAWHATTLTIIKSVQCTTNCEISNNGLSEKRTTSRVHTADKYKSRAAD